MNINRSLKLATVLLIVLVLSMGIYAFANSNTVNPSAAGDGTGAISGYTISTVHYVLNAANPGNVDSVTFTLSVAPSGTGTIKITMNGTNWYSCTNVTTAVTCVTTAPQATVLTATNLRVVVAD